MKNKTANVTSYKWSKIVLPVIIIAAVALLGVHLLEGSHAATAYYVSTSGSDSNSGTSASPWRTFKKGLSSVHAGDTLIVGGGTYIENIQSISVNGTASAPITVENASGQRPVIEGLVWGTYNYVTFSGINVTWNPSNTADEHMMKFNGGTGWRWTNSEIWGAHSWANILIALTPDKWSIDHDVIHDNYGSTSESDVQEHNFYVHTDYNANTSGQIVHNLIYNATRGENIKLDGTGDGTGGGNNITIEYNTMYNANRGILIGGQSHGNTFAYNIDEPTTGAGDADAVYLYKNSGTGNSIHNNVFFNYKALLNSGGGNASIVPMTNNTTGVDPQFDSTYHPANAAVSGYGYYAGGNAVTPPPPPPADTTAPSASLTAPASGTTVGASTTISANATDNVGVSKVDFYSGSTLIGSDTTAPYSYTWNTSSVANGSYVITAKATDAAGNVGTSGAVSVIVSHSVTPPADTTAPSSPSGLHGSASTTASNTFAWTASTDNVGVAGYDVLRNGIKVGTVTKTSFTDSGLTAKTTYSYNVVAFDAAGNRSANSASLVLTTATATGPTADTQAPSVPGNVKASATSPVIVNVTWSASTDNVRVAGYVVQRNGVSLTTTQSTSFTDTTVSPGTAYTYKVLAKDAAGNVSTASAAAAVTTPKLAVSDTSAPTVPAGMKAVSVSMHEIDLSWSASTDNVGVKGYVVYRDGAQIASVTTTSFGDATLSANSVHTYKVLAYDAASNKSAQSAAVSATTQPQVASHSVAISAFSKSTTSSATSIKLVRPGATPAGTVLVATVTVRGDPKVTAPSGWTLVRKDTASNGHVMVASVYVKTASGNDPASYTFKFSSKQAASAIVVAVSGASAQTVVSSGHINSSSDTITATSADTKNAGSLVLGMFLTASDSTIKQPSSLVKLGEATSSAGKFDISTQVSWNINKSSSTGTLHASASKSAVNIGQIIVISPSSK